MKVQGMKKLGQYMKAQVMAEAVVFARVTAQEGFDLNVTRTPPGRYRRTGLTRGTIRATATRSTLTVSASRGARHVEFGTPALWSYGEVRVDWLTGRVSGIPGMNTTRQAPISLGRSGQMWRTPGPFLAPAVIATAAFLKGRIEALAREVTK